MRKVNIIKIAYVVFKVISLHCKEKSILSATIYK